MRRFLSLPNTYPVLAGIFAAAFASFAGAQPVDEVTVVGHHADKGLRDTVSYRVGYADLNLQTKEGQDALAERIKTTAAYVCEKLGEAKQGHSVCIDSAIKDAQPAARKATKAALESHVAWKPGPAWSPPQ
jgi:UrcA family protein